MMAAAPEAGTKPFRAASKGRLALAGSPARTLQGNRSEFSQGRERRRRQFVTARHHRHHIGSVMPDGIQAGANPDVTGGASPPHAISRAENPQHVGDAAKCVGVDFP